MGERSGKRWRCSGKETNSTQGAANSEPGWAGQRIHRGKGKKPSRGQPRQDKASTDSARMQNKGMGVSSYNHKGPRSGIGNYCLQGNNQVTRGWRQQEWRSRKERWDPKEVRQCSQPWQDPEEVRQCSQPWQGPQDGKGQPGPGFYRYMILAKSNIFCLGFLSKNGDKDRNTLLRMVKYIRY